MLGHEEPSSECFDSSADFYQTVELESSRSSIRQADYGIDPRLLTDFVGVDTPLEVIEILRKYNEQRYANRRPQS